MDLFSLEDNIGDDYGNYTGRSNVRDTAIQLVLSLVIGISAFIAFCVSSTLPKNLSNKESH